METHEFKVSQTHLDENDQFVCSVCELPLDSEYHSKAPEKSYLETNTTEYKPHGELTNDFDAPEKDPSLTETSRADDVRFEAPTDESWESPLFIETVERIVIDYANLSGRESANRSQFRDLVKAHLGGLIQKEREKWEKCKGHDEGASGKAWYEPCLICHSKNKVTPKIVKKIDESDDWGFNPNMLRGKLNEIIDYLRALQERVWKTTLNGL